MFVLDYGDLVYIHASFSILKSLDLIHYTSIFFISQFHVSLCSVSEQNTAALVTVLYHYQAISLVCNIGICCLPHAEEYEWK